MSTALYDSINILTEGTHSARTVNAYTVAPTGTTVIDAAAVPVTRRTRTFPVPNTPTGLIAGAEGGVNVLIPFCANSTYLFGYDYTAKALYRSTDGTTWSAALQAAWTITSPLIALSNGSIITTLVAEPNCALKISTDNGTTFADAINTAGGTVTMSGKFGLFNMGENGTGGVALGTWGLVTNPAQIWYSSDYGINWTKGTFEGVVEGSTVAELPAGFVTHIHSICWSAGMGLWVANTGDGIGRRMTFKSTNGIAWAPHITEAQGTLIDSGVTAGHAASTVTLAVTTPTGNSRVNGYRIRITSGNGIGQIRHIMSYVEATKIATLNCAWTTQPDDGSSYVLYSGFAAPDGQSTRYRDYGNSTSILSGSDINSRVDLLNLTTWVKSNLVYEFPWSGDDEQTPTEAYYETWDIRKINETWYAALSCVSSVPTAHRYATIFASTDMVNWVPYWQSTITSTVGFLNITGMIGNKIHIIATTTDSTWSNLRHLSITPASINTKAGLALSGATTNLFTAAQSECSSVVGWNAAGWDTIEVSATTFLSGTSSLHFAEANNHYSLDSPVVISPNVTLLDDVAYVARAWVKGNCADVKFYLGSSVGRTYSISPDSWSEIYSEPVTGTGAASSIRIYPHPSLINDDIDLYVDCVEVVPVPCPPWQIGGAAKDAESLSYTTTLGTDWTHTFTVRLDDMSDSTIARRNSSVSPGTLSFTHATNLVTWTGHGILDQQAIYFSGADLPDGLVDGTTYYADVQDANTFTVYTEAALINLVDLLDDGTGNRACTIITGTVKPLVTYKVDAANYVTLGWDQDYGRWSLKATDDSVAGASAVSANKWYHRGAVVRVAVRCTNESLRLSTAYAGTIEHVTTAVAKSAAGAAEPMAGASRIIITGSVAGADVLPHILMDSQLYNTSMSDTILDEMFANASWEKWKRNVGGINIDW